MKKTYNINLGGIVYHIDEDAYELLEDYLTNLRIHFDKEDEGEEIVHDMELRISELFTERLSERKQVITLTDVEEIISQMGKPEELSETSIEEDIQQSSCDTHESKGVKRLFRNPDNKVIGGVCSGMAAYFGWDVTLVRIFLIIFAILFKSIVIFYIVAWIIIPEAQTASEKLSMKGMEVNVENIGKTVTNGFEQVNNYMKSDKPRSLLQQIGEGIVSVVGFLLKCLLVFAAVCCTPFLFVLLVVCFSLLMSAIGLIGSLPELFYVSMPYVDWSVISSSSGSALLLSISGILVIGIPIVAFVHFLMSTFGGWKSMPLGTRITLLILWLMALGIGTFFMINFGLSAIHVDGCPIVLNLPI